jgi:uncharacterized protein
MMQAMRKANREIKDRNAVRAIIEEARVCRIGLSDNGIPYIVPMKFGLGENCIYLHCAAEGRKLDVIWRNNRVCFEMDLLREVVLSRSACDSSARYESVIGFGRASIVEEPGEKRTALDRIMEHYGVQGTFIYQDDILGKTTVILIAIESLTAKRQE